MFEIIIIITFCALFFKSVDNIMYKDQNLNEQEENHTKVE